METRTSQPPESAGWGDTVTAQLLLTLDAPVLRATNGKG